MMMGIRPSSLMISALLLLGAAVLAMFVHAYSSTDNGLATRAQLVEQLGLTDLALFTEARYTRHPSQADLHSAFQDHPMSLDHFPSGSLVSPPRHNFASSSGVQQ